MHYKSPLGPTVTCFILLDVVIPF